MCPPARRPPWLLGPGPCPEALASVPGCPLGAGEGGLTSPALTAVAVLAGCLRAQPSLLFCWLLFALGHGSVLPARSLPALEARSARQRLPALLPAPACGHPPLCPSTWAFPRPRLSCPTLLRSGHALRVPPLAADSSGQRFLFLLRCPWKDGRQRPLGSWSRSVLWPRRSLLREPEQDRAPWFSVLLGGAGGWTGAHVPQISLPTRLLPLSHGHREPGPGLAMLGVSSQLPRPACTARSSLEPLSLAPAFPAEVRAPASSPVVAWHVLPCVSREHSQLPALALPLQAAL